MNERAPHILARTLAALGWTQAELARRSGVVQPTISAVLAGKRGGKFSPASADKILGVLSRLQGAPDLSRRAAVLLSRLSLKHLIFAPGPRT